MIRVLRFLVTIPFLFVADVALSLALYVMCEKDAIAYLEHIVATIRRRVTNRSKRQNSG